MAGSLNKVMLIGNVGRDPEMRYTPSGTPVTSFSVACGRVRVSPDGERREETEWFNVVAWNKLAETVSQYLTKGQKVYVEGRLQTRSWEGQDGQKRSRTEVVANTLIFLSPKQRPAGTEDSGTFEEVEDPSVEDLPF